MTVKEQGPTLPIQVRCPNCQSPAGEKCTSPTDTSRRPLARFHAARESAAADVDRAKAEAANSDGLNRAERVIRRFAELGVEVYDYAYSVVLDDRFIVHRAEDGDAATPVYQDHIHGTFRSREDAIKKALDQYRFCKGKFDVYVTLIDLSIGRGVGNVLSLSAVGPDGHGFFDEL